MFPVPPSIRAIIEVDVSFPEFEWPNLHPVLGIYTTKYHINIKKQCTHVRYGQLLNENLHLKMRKDRGHLKTPRCLRESDGKMHCRGNITVQDFKPRKLSFSFGFRCTWISSLKGLTYNISIHQYSNKTNCIQLPYNDKMEVCEQYYQHTTLPNLVGAEDMRRVLQLYKLLITYDLLIGLTRLCYQHLQELFCYTLVPKCDPVSKQVTHPCREMCHDFRTACSKITLPKSKYLRERILHEPNVISGDNAIIVDTSSYHFDCNYLPSLGGDIPCLYKTVTCKNPPLVKNATKLNISMDYNNYSVLDTIEYSCNEGFEIIGNKKISCMFSGEWSTSPKCYLPSISTTPLVVVLPVLLIPLLILLATIVIKKSN